MAGNGAHGAKRPANVSLRGGYKHVHQPSFFC